MAGQDAPVSERGSLAPVPLAPHQQVKIVDQDAEAQRERELQERERQALLEAEAQQKAVEEARAAKRKEAEERSRAAAAKRRAEIDAQAKERRRKLEAQKRERELKAKERKEQRAARAGAPAGKTPGNSPSEVKALDDLFPTEGEAAATPQVNEVEALEETTQAVDVSAFAPALDREAQEQAKNEMPAARSAAPTRSEIQSTEPTRPALGTPKKDDGFAAIKKKDDLSVIAPIPVEMRMELAPQVTQLPAIRLALLDTDLTRADAIAGALRDRGMKIHPVTPDPDSTRWPVLRRFAPQGLIVDEKSMARGAAEWVETFRGDPFLRHVPVILVRFSRVFNDRSADVNLEPVLHLIEHLGREEFALLDKLGPGKQVDLWLSQLAPFRLVEMLTREDRNTRLDCKGDDERLVWHLGPGYAGKGKSADLKTGEPRARLTPEDSLNWLLGHEDCQVSVQEHSEPLAHASESKDSEELLKEMTEALAAPSRHESVRPAAMSRAQRAPSLPQPTAGQIPPNQAPGAPSGVPTLSSSALLSEAAEQPGAVPPMAMPQMAAPQPPAPPKQPFLTEERKEKLRATARLIGAKAKYGYGAYRSHLEKLLTPLEAKVPQDVLKHAHWALPLLLLCVFLLTSSLSGGAGADAEGQEDGAAETDSPPSDSPKAKKPAPKITEKPAPSKEATEAEKPAEKEEEPEDDAAGDGLWHVAPDSNKPSCEERLGASAPKGEDPIKAVGYLRQARKLLMVGKTDEAVQNMCLAGLFDPKGPAAEGLAEYYLGQRSLKEAERWIQLALEASPDKRTVKELKGDIENQKGNFEESKKLILETMMLTGTETKKMELTARKLKADAALARRGGDLPRAERELRRAAILKPTDAVIASDLGEILLRRNTPEGAAKWAAHSLKLDPNHSVAMLLSGRIAEASGKKNEARTFYEMVPIGDPFHKEAQRRRGRL
jgi:Flp pilus assembly protein TadD